MTKNSLVPAIRELERLHQEFAPLFDRELPMPTITIIPAGRKAALGWFWAGKWKDGKKLVADEINLSAEHLARRADDICETLIHEMVHQANHLDGVKDCSKSGHHNKRFKARAESVGLVVERMERKGWAYTKLSPELRRKVRAAKPDIKAFRICRPQGISEPKAPTKMKKWSCDCTIVRCAVDLKATCDACEKPFKVQD